MFVIFACFFEFLFFRTLGLHIWKNKRKNPVYWDLELAYSWIDIHHQQPF